MKTRHAEATWTGRLRDGEGEIEFESGAFKGGYTHAARFEEGSGTNPEEMVGGALAGCFAQYLAVTLEEAGHPPEELHVSAAVNLDTDELVISSIDLTVEGTVPGMDQDAFQEAAEEAKAGCPVSKAVNGPEKTVTATLT